MGLTLNSLSLTSGTGGSGLTESAVKDMLEYEYIGKVSITSGVSNISVTQGVDNTVYDGFSFHIVDFKFSVYTYPVISVLNSSGTVYNTTGYISIKEGTSRTYDNTSSMTTNDINISPSIDNSNKHYIKVDVDCPIGTTYINGRFFCSYDTSPNSFSHGSFKTSGSNGFGGIKFGPNSGSLAQGDILIYGRRKRT